MAVSMSSRSEGVELLEVNFLFALGAFVFEDLDGDDFSFFELTH